MDLAVRFRWLGVAGIELRVSDQVLLIDPFLTRPPFRRMWFGRIRSEGALVAAKIPQCDFVLVTHAHWDHLMDVPEVIQQTNAMAFGSPNACRLLALLGVAEERIHEIKVGDRLPLGAFQVEVLPAEHGLAMGRPFATGPLAQDLRPPLRMRDYRVDKCLSFLIQVGRHRLVEASERPEQAVPADVLFVAPSRERAYYEVLLEVVQPRVVIPIHWDDFFRPLSKPIRPMFKPPTWSFPPLQRMDLTAFRQEIKRVAPATEVFLPEIFCMYDLSEFV